MIKSILPLLVVIIFVSSLASLNAQKLDHRQGELIICLHPEGALDQITKRYGIFDNQPTNLSLKKCLSRSGLIWQITFDFAEIHQYRFLDALKADPAVRIAQLNHFLKPRSSQPNDPLLDEQWQWLNIGARSEDQMGSISRAWDVTTGGVTALGDTIVVAAIDVGVNDQHEDLRQNIWYNWAEIPDNGIDDDENGYVDDFRGWNVVEENDDIDPEGFAGSLESHGTEILGTIGSVGNNGKGVTGVNWDVKMMNVYFNSDLNEADMIGAYGYILEQRKLYNESNGERGAYVVSTNLSYGDEELSPDETPIWCAIYDMLGEVGILSCAATANEPLDIDEIKDVPTSCGSDFLISVTASDINDQRTFGAYGKNDIDLAAPGENIYTTNLTTYGVARGTSFAAPIVAGAVALLYSSPCSDLANLALSDPAAAANWAREILFQGVDLIDSLADEVSTGGRLNVFNAISASISSCSACVAPFDISANVTANLVTISWNTTDSVVNTKLEFRLQGDTTWMQFDSAVSPYSITDLGNCRTYEYQLTSTCLDSTTAISNVGAFTTSSCCDDPGSLQLLNVDDQSALISWDTVPAALSYEVRYTSVDTILWDTITGIDGTSIQIDSLDLCTEYLVQVRSICPEEMSAYRDTLPFRTKGCGPCLDSTYCTLNVQPFGAEWIETFRLNTIDNESGYNEGYGDFTGDATTLKSDNRYELTFIPGFAGDTLGENYYAWIDYNQNGAFENETELVYTSDTAVADDIVTGSFVVPADAPEGLTRLRIMMLFEPIDTVTGCDMLVDLGEAEDYCVNIVFDSLLCPKPTGIDTANFAGTATDIVWERVDSAIAYTIRYRKMGEEEWEEVADTAIMYSLSELEECAEYEVQVQAVCQQDTSGYTESFVFKTFCSTGLPEIASIESYDVFPNPFASELNLLVRSSEISDARLQLFQLNGLRLQIRQFKIGIGETRLSLSNLDDLPPGIYVLALDTAQGRAIKKLIKS